MIRSARGKRPLPTRTWQAEFGNSIVTLEICPAVHVKNLEYFLGPVRLAGANQYYASRLALVRSARCHEGVGIFPGINRRARRIAEK
jgi:hypothetical protein